MSEMVRDSGSFEHLGGPIPRYHFRRYTRGKITSVLVLPPDISVSLPVHNRLEIQTSRRPVFMLALSAKRAIVALRCRRDDAVWWVKTSIGTGKFWMEFLPEELARAGYTHCMYMLINKICTKEPVFTVIYTDGRVRNYKRRNCRFVFADLAFDLYGSAVVCDEHAVEFRPAARRFERE